MSLHQKRISAPRSWPIERKTHKWIVRPRPGPHPFDKCLALSVVIKDHLNIADTTREARRIIGARKILVDGVPVRDSKRGVGLMDVISVPASKEHFRVLLDNKGKIRLNRISADEAGYKLVRIENKTIVKKGVVQLNLHDGRNILLKKDNYRTGDVLKISLPDQKIKGHIPFVEGSVAIMIQGNHVGQLASISSYEIVRSPRPNIVTFKDGFSTIKDYVFVVGKRSPEISLLEVSST